jgi:hypothetical protein
MNWAKAWMCLRVGVLLLGAAFLIHHAWDQAGAILGYQPLGIDFLPMWSAAREAFSHPARIYDFAGLTHFEHPLLGHFRGLRPFVYPPPALLLYLPFSLAPFTVADPAWIMTGVFAIVGVMAMKLRAHPLLLLAGMLLTPASVLVVVTGQVTFLIAAMAIGGVFALKDRPVLAGVLFGLAGAIKPQALVLAPIALLALRQWRTLGAAALAAALAVLVSGLVFGVHAWEGWLAAVPRFQRMVMASPGLTRGMVTPTVLGAWLGLGPDALTMWRLAFGLGAVVICWGVFASTEDPARRIAALLGGGLFITPYAMHYDAALLAPVAALMLSTRTGFTSWVLSAAAAAALCCAAIPHWGALAVTGFVLWAALAPETMFAGRLAFADRGSGRAVAGGGLSPAGQDR